MAPVIHVTLNLFKIVFKVIHTSSSISFQVQQSTVTKIILLPAAVILLLKLLLILRSPVFTQGFY
jgi:hypothetical protein